MTDDQHPSEGETADFSPRDGEPTSGAMFGGGFGGGSGSGPSPAGEGQPERIGPYRIVGLIGRGGMGAVYRAIRENEAGQRIVAIKVVKRGVDTEEVLKRFDIERQVLGALDHPNIARFYEAGETDDGRPYFVMEHVEGQRIDEYCDANALTISRRLELFQKVCDAIHHAHTNLVVHRDLKPDNILVTPTGEPKLLDFGIAKLLNPAMARAEIVTGPAVRMMTPEYASPEQVQGSPVRTVSDVYSLGVLLYELLCGHRPYRIANRLEQEIIRVICETDPERPSTALSNTEELHLPDGGTRTITPDLIAKRRAGRRETLRKQIAGDLDDIVFKAMEKAPDRRYPSAEAMSEDIGRHLVGQPIEARRVGGRTGYVVRKFVKRHRTAVISSSAIGFLFFLGCAIIIVQLMTIGIARKDAANAYLDQQIATSISETLWHHFTDADIELSLTLDQRQQLWANIHGSLDDIASDTTSRDGPIIRNALAKALLQGASVLGDTRGQSFGETDEALAMYRDIKGILTGLQVDGPDGYQVAKDLSITEIRIADLLRSKHENSAAVSSYQEAIRWAMTIPETDNKYWSSLRIRATAITAIGEIQLLECKFESGIESLLQAMTIKQEIVSLTSIATHANSDYEKIVVRRSLAVGHTKLGNGYTYQRDDDAADEHYDHSLSIRRDLLADDSESIRYRRDVAVVLFMHAESLNWRGASTEANDKLTESIPMIEELIDEEPDDARNRRTLILMLLESSIAEYALGDFDAAGSYAGRAMEHLDELRLRAPDYAYLPGLTAQSHTALARIEFERADLGLARANIRTAQASLDRLRAEGEFSPDLQTLELELHALRSKAEPESGHDDTAKNMLERMDSAGEGCRVSDRLREAVSGLETSQ